MLLTSQKKATDFMCLLVEFIPSITYGGEKSVKIPDTRSNYQFIGNREDREKNMFNYIRVSNRKNSNS